MVRVVHDIKTTHTCRTARRVSSKGVVWAAVGVAALWLHEPGGTDVSQPSCMTGRRDLSLSTPQSQPGEGAGPLAPVLDGLLSFCLLPSFFPPLKKATEPAGTSSAEYRMRPAAVLSKSGGAAETCLPPAGCRDILLKVVKRRPAEVPLT